MKPSKARPLSQLSILTLLTQTLCETQTSHPRLLLPHLTGEHNLNMKIPSIWQMVSSACLILIL